MQITGKYVNHKGKSRHFTSAEELEEERKKQELKKRNRKPDEESEDESESEEEASDKSGSENSDSDEESSEDENAKAKGPSGLIDIENPNRVQKKAQKVKNLTAPPTKVEKPELSRREREELEKQRAQANYQKLHAEGKTEQARADLARLAIIKQARAEAAAKRDQEKKGLFVLHFNRP